jgi:hypothetical protein
MTSKILRHCSTALALGMAAVLSLAADRAAAQPIQGDLSELLQGLPSNWDRWGEGDQVGSINFLDQEQVLRGAAAAVQGRCSPFRFPCCMVKGRCLPAASRRAIS